MIDWLFTNALVALALAAIAGVLIWTFRPAPAVRHALWLVVVLKLVSPTGLVVSVPLPVEPPAAMKTVDSPAVPELISDEPVVEAELFTVTVTPKPGQSMEDAAAAALHADDATHTGCDTPAAAATLPGESPHAPFDYRPYLLGLWAAGALYSTWRQLRETLRFARFTRKSQAAGASLIAEVANVANRLGVRMPTVRVLPGLSSPVLWCLWRPILLWPAGLECRLKGDGRRAVLTHELAHLRRRDHWARRLEMIAAVLHWWNPLFWVARKKMRADAELACDAWAAGQADRRAYAEALLEVCSFNPRRRPAPAVGVIGEGRRAMQERLTMIMRDRVPCRLAFGAKLVVALMAIAAVPAWTLGQSAPPPASSAADPQAKAIEEQIKALTQKIEALKAAKRAEAEKRIYEKNVTEAKIVLGEKMKELRLQIDGNKATMHDGGVKVVGPGSLKMITAGEGGYKVVGPDGKELKDVKILVVDGRQHGGAMTVTGKVVGTTDPTAAAPAKGPASYTIVGDGLTGKFLMANPGQNVHWATTTASAGNSITLSRATYKLGKDQASALATLLKAIKATVMETKVDGDAITVTTTPEAQSAIGQIVHLMQGHSGNVSFEWKLAQPAVPAKPRAPTPPAVPKPPAPPKPTTSELTPNVELGIIKRIELLDNEKPIELELKLDATRLKDLEKLHDQLKLLIPSKPEKPSTDKKPSAGGR